MSTVIGILSNISGRRIETFLDSVEIISNVNKKKKKIVIFLFFFYQTTQNAYYFVFYIMENIV